MNIIITNHAFQRYNERMRQKIKNKGAMRRIIYSANFEKINETVGIYYRGRAMFVAKIENNKHIIKTVLDIPTLRAKEEKMELLRERSVPFCL